MKNEEEVGRRERLVDRLVPSLYPSCKVPPNSASCCLVRVMSDAEQLASVARNGPGPYVNEALASTIPQPQLSTRKAVSLLGVREATLIPQIPTAYKASLNTVERAKALVGPKWPPITHSQIQIIPRQEIRLQSSSQVRPLNNIKTRKMAHAGIIGIKTTGSWFKPSRSRRLVITVDGVERPGSFQPHVTGSPWIWEPASGTTM